MADSSIAGLFMTPELYQQQQDTAALSRAMQMAQLDPMQRANAMLGYGGYKAASGLASALGVQDPMLQQLSAVQGVMKGINPNDPSSLMQAAQQLSSVAPQQAAALAQQARAAQEQLAKTSSEGIVGKLLATGKYTPESIAAFQQSGKSSDLVTVDKFTKPPADFLSKAVELGFGEKARIGEYSPDQVAKINQAIFNEDIRKKAAGATNVSLSATADKSYGSELGGLVAKKDVALFDAANAAPDILSSVKQQRDLLDSGKVLTGLGANAKLNILAFGKALGVTGASDNEIIANTQQLQQQRAQATLNRVKASGLGTGQGFTDKDREFLEKAVAGNVTYDAETIRRQLQAEENAAKAMAKGWNTRVKGLPEDVKRSMGLSEVSLPDLTQGTTAQIPTTSGPIYASNGKQRIVSTDGGRTWKPAQ